MFTFFLLVDFECKERQILILKQCSTRKDYTRNTVRKERKLHIYMRAEIFRIFIVFSIKIDVFQVKSSTIPEIRGFRGFWGRFSEFGGFGVFGVRYEPCILVRQVFGQDRIQENSFRAGRI